VEHAGRPFGTCSPSAVGRVKGFDCYSPADDDEEREFGAMTERRQDSTWFNRLARHVVRSVQTLQPDEQILIHIGKSLPTHMP
jgi:hypothetical protein